MKVPSTENLQQFMWVNACANEVQNLRFVTAPDTEIVPDDPGEQCVSQALLKQ